MRFRRSQSDSPHTDDTRIRDLDNRTKIMYDNYMRCALYARVSTTDQNCEMQLRELREYISRRE